MSTGQKFVRVESEIQLKYEKKMHNLWTWINLPVIQSVHSVSQLELNFRTVVNSSINKFNSPRKLFIPWSVQLSKLNGHKIDREHHNVYIPFPVYKNSKIFQNKWKDKNKRIIES